MKKLFTLIACALMALSASAGSTVGSEDNTSGWWTAFSDYYTVKEGQKAHVTFKNYSSKTNVWNNWVIVFNVAGTERNGEGYSEYGVFRSDSYGWGANVATDQNNVHTYLTGVSLVNNFNWDTFKDDMDGATVAMDVYNEDGAIYCAAVITTSTGTVYNYSFNTSDTSAKDFGFFLTTELGHLTDVNVTMTDITPTAAGTVGKEDNTSAWWTAFSDYYTVEEGQKAHVTFKNYSCKASTWNNWLIVYNVAGTVRGGTGYAEYGVFRADNYGWGANVGHNSTSEEWLDGVNIANDFNWDTFKDDMDGASVAMDVYNSDGSIYNVATITTTAGKVYNYSFNTNNTGAKNFDFFLTTEKGHLTDVNVTIGSVDAINNVSVASSAFSRKYIQNGNVVISKNGKRFNAVGAMLK